MQDDQIHNYRGLGVGTNGIDVQGVLWFEKGAGCTYSGGRIQRRRYGW